MQQITIPTPYVVGDVHVYSAELAGELVLFDTGPATPEALASLRQQVDLTRLRHVFITHCHIDHYGLAAWLADHTEAQIHLPRKDALKIEHHELRLAGIEELLLQIGFDRDYVARFRDSVQQNGIFPRFPTSFGVVEESDLPAQLGFRWLNCPGHSQSDLVYLGDDWAITGDTLLRGIFQAPLLDLDLDRLQGRFGNYRAYCASLTQMEQLRGKQILPGHRGSVESLEETILFYVNKLAERATRVERFAGEEDVSVLLRQLFGSGLKEPFHIYLKVSEIVFMRDFLTQPELLREALTGLDLLPRIESNLANLLAT